MIICPENICTGCAACLNACPKSCIEFNENVYGELHPIINESKCIQCKLCIKSCPNSHILHFNFPLKCYASWIDDVKKRRKCASGGIGTIMSEYIIKHKQGVVFGTSYDNDFIPRATYTESLEGLEAFKGSKYVQSIVGPDTFRKVNSFLLDGRFVLYIGTPCQISGLNLYLRNKYDNLITVDLICHGVCPTKYFKEEVDTLVNKYNVHNLVDVRFRGNDTYKYKIHIWEKLFKKKPKGNNYAMTLWKKNVNGIVRCYRGDIFHNYYLAGFLMGVSLRENCYACKYARPERISDITIGDFIGLGKTEPFEYSRKNVSSVTINTKKGNSFYTGVMDDMKELRNVERKYEERLEYKLSLVNSFPRHHLNKKFREKYQEHGYSKAIKETLFWYLMKSKVKQSLKGVIHFPVRIYVKVRKSLTII